MNNPVALHPERVVVRSTWFNSALNRWMVRLSDGRETYRYRWIAECALSRRLATHEHVHHINGDSADDRPENLIVLDGGQHVRLHALGREPANKLPERKAECAWCGLWFVPPHQGKRVQRFCSKGCATRNSNAVRRAAA